MAFASYWKSDAIALRGQPGPARRPEEYRRLHNLVEGLCIAGGLPKPRLYVVDDPAPNAFATGRNPKHAAIAVTTGLLEKMNRVELEGVLAHELSHIQQLRHPRLDARGHDGRRRRADDRPRDPDDVVERWASRPRRRPRRTATTRSRSSASSLLIVAPIVAKVDAGDDLAAPRDAGRRQRVPAHPVPARADLGAREAARTTRR